MLYLYHFTCRNNIDKLVADGILRRGSIISKDATLINSAAISLTDDESPEGHGLPDGRVVTFQQAQDLGAYWKDGGLLRCLDHTKYRMRFSFNRDDPALVRAEDYYADAKSVLRSLEEGAYLPVTRHVSSNQHKEIIDSLNLGKLVRKGHTWWYYFADIDLSRWVDICVRTDDGYAHVSKDDFLKLLNQLNLERM